MNHRRQIAALFFLLTLALAAPLLFGEDATEAVFFASTDKVDKLTNGILWVVGFLLLLGVVAYFLSDFVRNRRLGPLKRGRAKRLRVADVCALGNRQFVFVIECGGERHLVGAWTNGVRYLSRLPSDSEDPFETKLDVELQSSDQEDDEE